MATIKQERDANLEVVKGETEKMKSLYEKYIEILTFTIAASHLSLKEKTARINEKVAELVAKQKEISAVIVDKIYTKSSQDTQKKIGVKETGLSSTQMKDVNNIKTQLNLDLDSSASLLRNKSLKAVKKLEQERIIKEMNEVTGAKRLAGKKKDAQLVFNDSLGRKIQPINSVELIVEDTLWSTMHIAMAGVLVHNGLRYVIHHSVIDDRTTQICLSLDGKVRDVLSDELPPLHARCRSTTTPILDKNFKNDTQN